MNLVFFTDIPKQVYNWGIGALKTRVASVDELSLCSHTCLSVGDIISMSKFSSRCSIDRLTMLNLNVSSTTEYSILKNLDDMTKNPQGSTSTCPRKLEKANFPIPRTALVSHPGSGNTWTRHLVQQLTGLHSGSIYANSYISKRGFPYEGVINNMIVIKTHAPPKSDGSLVTAISGEMVKIQFDRLLILLRNPFASFMAEFKRSKMNLGKVGTGHIDPKSEKWKSFVTQMSKRWKTFATQAFTTTLPLLVIYYEDLQSCLLPELVKISSFFRSENLNEFAYCCTLKQHEGSYHRAPSNQTIEDVYPSGLRTIINEVLQEVAAVVKELYPEVAKRIMRYMLP